MKIKKARETDTAASLVNFSLKFVYSFREDEFGIVCTIRDARIRGLVREKRMKGFCGTTVDTDEAILGQRAAWSTVASRGYDG